MVSIWSFTNDIQANIYLRSGKTYHFSQFFNEDNLKNTLSHPTKI